MTRSRTRHPWSAHLLRTDGSAALALSLLLVLAAYGGGGAMAADPSPTATAAGSADQSTADSDSEDAVPQAIKDLASETGSGTVTIGDETWAFSFAGVDTVDGTVHVGICKSLFGMVAGNGYATDGSDVTVSIEVPPTDWATYEDDRYSPPAVRVEDDANNASWVADEGNEYAGSGAVGEFEQDGTSASGSATFVNQWAPDSAPVEGTFTIDCEA